MDISVGEASSGSRKKLRSKSLAAQKRKYEKYGNPDPQLIQLKQKPRPCSHNSKAFRCNEVTLSDLMKNRNKLYSAHGKTHQDSALLHFISACDPQRERPRDGRKRKTLSVKYFLRTTAHGMVGVCKEFFCFGMGVSKARVLRIAKVVNSGEIPKEKRGGDKISKKFAAKREAVKNFIRHLRGQESHYGRNKSKRIYLAADLNISKLHKLYQNSSENCLKVKFPFFYKIFVNDFNIGFSSPAKDVCALCTRLTNEIKGVQDNQNKQQQLRTELRIHKMRSNAFYDIMKKCRQEENWLAFSFDLQQVHPLPKTPIQDAFYSRQLAFYAFCCTGLSSIDPTFYTWSEDQAGRGSTEIGSALLHHIQSLNFPPECNTIYLFCDGCAGQNRNAHIVHTLCHWLKTKSPKHIKTLQLTFPVRGHSFIPPDRAFGRVEKILKKHPVINTKDEYVQYYKEVGSVRELGKDWFIYDIKMLQSVYSKTTGISDAKRIIIHKHSTRQGNTVTKVKFITNYRFESSQESQERSLVKKGKEEDSLILQRIDMRHPISAEKKRDVISLLCKTHGENWKEIPELDWYVQVLYQQSHNENNENEADEEVVCDCLVDDCGLRI